jgi:hypothetical protein
MGRRAPQKCVKCALLSIEDAIALHGPNGRGEPCWNPNVCHRRRSHYRHRDENNRKRRTGRISASQMTSSSATSPATSPITSPPTSPSNPSISATSSAVVEVDLLPSPHTSSAVLVMYQATADAPLHAIGAEVWLGNEKKAIIKPVHCLGMRSPQIKEYIAQRMLPILHQHFGIMAFEREYKVLHPNQCPLEPCPLKELP